MSHVSIIEGHDTRQPHAIAKTAEESMLTCVKGRTDTVYGLYQIIQAWSRARQH